MNSPFIVEVDQSFQFDENKKFKQLSYQYVNAMHYYFVNKHNDVETDLILFPGIRSCHVIIAKCTSTENFWVSHISKAQQYSEYVGQHELQPPPIYQQLLAENYQNQSGISANKKIDFIIIDPSVSFDRLLFDRVFKENIHSLRLFNPIVPYSDAPIFIFYQHLERKIFCLDEHGCMLNEYPLAACETDD